jgi:hypothetical protein
MTLPGVQVTGWSLQLPGMETIADLESWLQEQGAVDPAGKIAAPSIPPAQRRRCSRLTKLAVEAGVSCCGSADQDVSGVAKVLATRHGEIVTTLRLLETLVRKDIPSPAGFINSVYHTPVGYFDLCTGNRHTARAVSGGTASFAYAFLESLSLLHQRPERPVLVVAGEESVPQPFTEAAGGRDHPWAMAVLLEAREGAGKSVALEFRPGPEDEPAGEPGTDALDFLAWWISGSAAFTMMHEQRRWTWRRR